MRGARPILQFTCIGPVIARKMKELRVDLRTVSNKTEIPYTTLYDWSQGVIPSNPDQVKKLVEYFEISLNEFYYGKDEDKEELKEIIKEQEEKLRKSEYEKGTAQAQLSIFEFALQKEREKTKQLEEELSSKDEKAKNETKSE